MEKTKKYCVYCHQAFICQRNPQQRYCGQTACQTVRKNRWRKQKKASDADYYQNQRRAEQNWRQRHPDYWRNYRATHPNYVTRNREQQCLRQRQRRLARSNSRLKKASPFANSDALSETINPLNPIKPGVYRLLPVTHPEFANSDALLVTLAVVTGVSTDFMLKVSLWH